MKILIIALIAALPTVTGCDTTKCDPKIIRSTLVVDVSDSTIISQFLLEKEILAEKLAPELKRCEGIHFDINPIGAKIESQEVQVNFPATGIINSTLGNYALEDSNKIKRDYLSRALENTVGKIQVAGNDSSQVFYTIVRLMTLRPADRIVVYTDLIENYGKVNFYKGVGNFEKTLSQLQKQYSLDSTMNIPFKGKISIISSLTKNQEKILVARSFYTQFFSKQGISASRFEFVGSISQSKFQRE